MKQLPVIFLVFLLVGCGIGAKINKKVYDLEVKRVTSRNTKEGMVINRELTFSDFQGIPSGAKAKHTLGVTGAKLDYSYHSPSHYNGKVYYQFYVSALFIPDRSWIKIPNDTLTLQHEQIHYEIYKVAAKELKQMLSAKAYDEVNFRQQMNEVFTNIRDKYDVIHAQFDIGEQRDDNNNKLWRSKVKEALQKGKFDIQ